MPKHASTGAERSALQEAVKGLLEHNPTMTAPQMHTQIAAKDEFSGVSIHQVRRAMHKRSGAQETMDIEMVATPADATSQQHRKQQKKQHC